MKKWLKYLFLGVVALFVLIVAGFYIWSQQTYKASEELDSLVDGNVTENGTVSFEPDHSNGLGIIIYPGAKVEPGAYGYYAQELAKEGYLVVVPTVRLNFAILDGNRADAIIETYPEIKTWVVGGHSLGGVAAASYAFDHKDTIGGVLFLASYPSNGSDFAGSTIPMLSLYGEKDGLTSLENIEDTKHLLSDAAQMYEIKGGNHAQFGLYGEQSGDQPASITAKEQQDEMIEVTIQWLNGLDEE